MRLSPPSTGRRVGGRGTSFLAGAGGGQTELGAGRGDQRHMLGGNVFGAILFGAVLFGGILFGAILSGAILRGGVKIHLLQTLKIFRCNYIECKHCMYCMLFWRGLYLLLL